MHATLVECLRCGESHRLHGGGLRYVQQGECPRCGYLGWAAPGEVTDVTRTELLVGLLEQPRIPVAG